MFVPPSSLSKACALANVGRLKSDILTSVTCYIFESRGVSSMSLLVAWSTRHLWERAKCYLEPDFTCAWSERADLVSGFETFSPGTQLHFILSFSSTAKDNMSTVAASNGAMDAKDPSGFLSEIIGAPVTVKLNSGVVYKGL